MAGGPCCLFRYSFVHLCFILALKDDGLFHAHISRSKSSTLMCSGIGTPKTINFPFVPNGKLIVFRCPNIKVHKGTTSNK